MASLTMSTFERLGLSATIYDGELWWPIHSTPDNLVAFETAHGVETARWTYNGRNIRAVVARKRSMLGSHAGHWDFFVPVIIDGDVTAVLVVGSFVTAPPRSADVMRRWQEMTGRQGRLADPAFAAFLSAELSMLVLDKRNTSRLRQLLECLGALMAGQGDAGQLANRAHALELGLERMRLPERVTESARAMLDERTSQARYSAAMAQTLRQLGLMRAADQVVVGLLRMARTDVHPVEEAIIRNAFQREAVELARAHGDAIAAPVGEQGVALFAAFEGSVQAKKQNLLALVRKARALAERRGLQAHFGVAMNSEAAMRIGYEKALSAAETALANGSALVIASPKGDAARVSLRQLRADLRRTVEEHPEALVTRFERYLEAVAVHADYRRQRAEPELQIFFELAVESLSRGGGLAAKSLNAMCERLEPAVSQADTLSELFAAYRRAIADLSEAVLRPVNARQDHGLRGAIDYIQAHYAEPLTLSKVARVAGFAPKYFSELFHDREKIPFDRYLYRLRIERAKQLLTGTDLNATRIAELSGLGNPQHLCHAFQRTLRMTPLEYRASRRPEWTRKLRRRSVYKRKRTQ